MATRELSRTFFEITYNGKWVGRKFALTVYQAIDLFYTENQKQYPDRTKLNAKLKFYGPIKPHLKQENQK